MTSAITGAIGETRRRDRVLSRLADNDRWLWRAMLAPAILYIGLLVGFPFLLSLYYSVSNVTVSSQSVQFVGLENFQRILESRTFWLSLQNTIVITVVSQFFVLVFANILATALAADFRGRWLVRLLILLPWVAPISLGSIGWLWIFDSIYSVINWTARAVGLLGPNEWPIWLGQPTLARASIIIVNVWRILPLATVIVLAGLSSIPQDIHDAAEVDGAGFWRHHFQITMPLILPITLVALLSASSHVHRHDRGVRTDARRSLRHHTGYRQLGVFYGNSGWRSGGRGRHLSVSLSGPRRRCDPVLVVSPAHRGHLT
jgi:multiple sugar transport system permease protein